jgi:Leucine-rich repeat (LRR) protein
MKKNYAYLLLLCAFVFCKPNTIKAQVDVIDSLALVDLYNSTDGPHWAPNNWLTSAPVNEWTLVSTSGNRVTGLFLANQNLQGSIPSSIGNLTSLIGLYLAENQLSGSIPSSIGNLTKLTRLDLNDNQLSGSIPSSIGNLTELTRLYLYNNKLSGSIPSSIGNLTELIYLYLYHNQLSGSIPSSIGNLAKVDILYLNNNQLSEAIPSTMGNLPKARYIDVSHNKLSGSIPPELSNLDYTYSLNLSHNQLSGNIPMSLGDLKNLYHNYMYIDLSYNKLSGGIPKSINRLHALRSLYLNNNQLSGKIPKNFGKNLTNLDYLRLDHNQLRGPIPHAFINLKWLWELNLRDNYFNHAVPSFFATFNSLDIVNNHFTFDGMETVAAHVHHKFLYSYEKKIPTHQTNNTLSVYAGGTLSNNTYKWYKDGSLVSTINGDSTFAPTASGVYYAEVTNSVATELTLTSDTIHYTSSSGLQQDAIAAALNTKNSFSVYPNPAHDFINVYFNSDENNAVINIYDINGKKLTTQKTWLQKNNSISIDIASFAKGTYFLEMIADEKIMKQKFIKQ